LQTILPPGIFSNRRTTLPRPRIQSRNILIRKERTVSPTTALLKSLESLPESSSMEAVAAEARRGLTSAPKSLAPWLFYDETGSKIFEQITALPEYYLTRTERDIFTAHADEIFHILGLGNSTSTQEAGTIPFARPITVVELGAGTASKTGILLRALAGCQSSVLYQPIDISPTALDEAHIQLEATIPGVTIRPQVANYVSGSVHIERPPHARVLALYIGSSIGNFSPAEARDILTRLRAQLQPGDALLLGTDLAPCPPEVAVPTKSASTLLAAYNDKEGVTAAFNRNILARLNRELGANFQPEQFDHRALWNHTHSRIEMHLKSLTPQQVIIPANSAGGRLNLYFAEGETIHTENSHKFTPATIAALLGDAAFTPTHTFIDRHNLFAVTLAEAA
jgi:L-histidine N-alpha-methyltransferase